MSRNRDPYATGTPAHWTRAEWFHQLWQDFGYTRRVHLRRIHYQLVSQPDPRKADGVPYENTERDWEYLQQASVWARYLGLVDPRQIIDHRNPAPHLPPSLVTRTETHPEVVWVEERPVWDLPTIPTDLGSLLTWDFPEPIVQGYEYDAGDQPYHLELWVEKSTMNDILLPLAQRFHAALVTSVGFQSVTSAVDLVAGRVALSGKPVRLFYLSDFDPAGDAMPAAIARQIEFWRAQYAPEADIKLTPLALTLAQVEQYNLPTIPIKDSDTRKASFKERRGSDATELDALEALQPGTLARLVEDALRPYWDQRLFHRCYAVADAADARVQAAWEAATDDLADELRDIEQEVRPLLAQYAVQLAQLHDALEAELAPFAARLQALADAVQEAQEAFAPDLPPRATPDVDPGEDADWLFDSARSYLEQLAVYKARRAGRAGDEVGAGEC